MAERTVKDQAGGPTPSPELVRQELGNILASRPFAAAARSRRFLSYVTEKTLAGEHDTIKELVVGIEVFDRPNDFDPRADTIVRVEAGKLRKRLQEYYEHDGAGASLQIEIPKGGYVPRFIVGGEAPSVPPAPIPSRLGRWRWHYTAAALSTALVLLAMAVYWGVGSRPIEPSAAVLPFLNLSSDKSNEYFADGLTEDLTDALAHVDGIRVASRTSAFFFKGKQPDIHEVGARLKAGYVVEGSVRKEGQRFKITAQLVRTSDGYHIWSSSFERDISDIFAVQHEIAQSVASTLEQKLTGTGRQWTAPRYTANVNAFDLYMRGRHAAAAGILSDIDVPERLLRQATTADPAYPLPYVALADLYLHANILELRPSGELIGKAKGALAKALALDDKIAEAHSILGVLAARHEYDWVTAERHLRKAIELDPNSANAHNALAQNVLAPQGRWREALEEQRQAMELEPLSPLIAAGQPFLEYLQRRHSPANDGFLILSAAHPLDPGPLLGMAMSLMGKGDYASSIKVLNGMLRQQSRPLVLAMTGYAQARAGHLAEARKIVEQLTVQSKRRFVSPACFATVYVGLNDRDNAFEYLERARQDHESFLIFTRVDGIFDPVRSDPRFDRLLAQVGLDDEAVMKNQALARRVHR
jgi:TolB-like protein